jgi:hypothetical protein
MAHYPTPSTGAQNMKTEAAKAFEKCRKEYDKLPESATHGRIDHYPDRNSIYRLVRTAEMAIVLHSEGHEELDASTVSKVRRFVNKWQSHVVEPA